MEQLNTEVYALLKQTLRPEFLNRIDETIVFAPLGKTEVQEIVALQFAQLQEKLLERNIRLTATNEALNTLSKNSTVFMKQESIQ